MGRDQIKKAPKKIETRCRRCEAEAKDFDARMDREFPWYRKLPKPIGLVEMNKVFLVSKAIDDAGLHERSAKREANEPKVNPVRSKSNTNILRRKRK